MTIAYVNSNGINTSAVSPSNITITNGLGTGDQLVIMLRFGSTTVTPTVAITSGTGTVTSINSVTDSTNADTLYWYLVTNGSAGASNIQISWTGGASITCRAAYHEYSVAAGTILVTDQSAHAFTAGWAANAATTQSSGNTATTTQANELLVGFMKTENAHTTGIVAGTNLTYTLRQSQSKLFTEDVLVSSTGTYAATFNTVSGVGDPGEGANAPLVVIQTFYQSTPPPPGPPPFIVRQAIKRSSYFKKPEVEEFTHQDLTRYLHAAA